MAASESSTERAPEFTAVILAGGKANSLYPLTEDIPLSLLPVANRPLISFQLEMLARVGFRSVIVVVNKGQLKRVQSCIDHLPEPSTMTVFLEPVDEEIGSADALRAIGDRIKTDFIIIGGDTICDVAAMHRLADVHRLRSASLTMFAVKRHAPTAEAGSSKKKASNDDDDDGTLDLVGLDASSTRVVFLSPLVDVDNDLIRLRKSLFAKVPAVSLRRDLLDAHVYFFARWVIDLVMARPSISSIKGELVPFLINKQFRRSALLALRPLVAGETEEAEDLDVTASQPLLLPLSSPPLTDAELVGNLVRCHLVIGDGLYARRVTSLAEYQACNRDLARAGASGFDLFQPLTEKGQFIDPSAKISAKTQIGPESCIGKETVIGDRCSVKKSNIGQHCTIAANVKLGGVVIMDNVVIRENCQLQNVIVGSGARIMEGCTLKDASVSAACTVPEGTSGSNAVYTNATAQN